MSDTAIKFENISKQYRLGNIGTGTLSHDLNRWWAMNIQRKEDPYLTVGSVNQRDSKADSDYVWALKDIDFEVKQGEVLGIIGKNGAGKSTLLKLLSRVTAPTTGRIVSEGRIASLLEVGTGFHPEMTGRENIFMNGAIMGMTKAEIRRRFDEIVDFSGVERYIDTPVKRYSSGMTVRLGFAIAAHLEPEILVVDEVLAVGDAEFQKKAIGKMQDVSHSSGRTVLFVSHNMGAIEALCNRGIVLKNGQIGFNGKASEAVDTYLQSASDDSKQESKIIDEIDYLHQDIKLHSILINSSESTVVNLDQENPVLHFLIEGELLANNNFSFAFNLLDHRDVLLASYSPGHTRGINYKLPKGPFRIEEIVNLPKNMTKGEYRLAIGLHKPNIEMYMKISNHIKIVVPGIVGKTGIEFSYSWCGFLLIE